MSLIDQLDRLNAAQDAIKLAGPDEPSFELTDVEGEPVLPYDHYWKVNRVWGDADYILDDPDEIANYLESECYPADDYSYGDRVLKEDMGAELIQFDGRMREQAARRER